MTDQLKLKANTTHVHNKLAKKASLTTLNANISNLHNNLALKADTLTVTNNLALKEDQYYNQN